MQQVSHNKYLYKDSAYARLPNPEIYDSAASTAPPIAPLNPAFSLRSGPSWPQIAGIGLLGLIAILMAVWQPSFFGSVLYGLLWTGFMANALMRLAATRVKAVALPPQTLLTEGNLPAYSVIVALYKEARLAPQILAAMSAIDYPHDRLEILFALEADDADTIAAFRVQTLPRHMHVIEVPLDRHRTKPRALNHALAHATGDYIVIYDAEDCPHPLQLREAAAAFEKGNPKLACLQAPLRPVGGTGFIARQFAAEYAVQFDVLLPAIHRLGLPFPLGGTSNHFKADLLKSMGAWDAYNVTEDADLGLRLAYYGYQSDLLTYPTFETPPVHSRIWIPQRTRWIKGYIQTLLVHTRLNTRFCPRVWGGVGVGIALSLVAAVCYAPLTALTVLTILMSMGQTVTQPDHALNILHWRDLVLFLTGSLSAMVSLYVGTRRARLPFTWSDALSAPAYWCLQSLAFGFAFHQLVTRPFHWDKTEHTPAFEANAPHKALYEGKSSAYGLEDDYIGHPHHLADHRLG